MKSNLARKTDPLFSVTAQDCEWSYTRGTGAGGQKRNKTSSAVHCTHRASGAHGYSESSRSQLDNRRDAFEMPNADPLVIEGAGGLMVPLRRDWLIIDLFADLQLPVILCARTSLGTINHSLLSIEALRLRDIPIVGIAFIGEANADSENTICAMGGVRRLGRLPRLEKLERETLARAFHDNFDMAEFA